MNCSNVNRKNELGILLYLIVGSKSVDQEPCLRWFLIFQFDMDLNANNQKWQYNSNTWS